jgi:hypothetical protein
MTRYACKSYYDNDAKEKRWAVERQDGNVKRILQRSFITEEGAGVWLTRYTTIKKKHHEAQSIRDQKRRTIARMHDPRRAPTRGTVNRNHHHQYRPDVLFSAESKDFTPVVLISDRVKNCFKQSVSNCISLSIDCVYAVPTVIGIKKKGDWTQHHCFTLLNWYSNPIALDICMSACCCGFCLTSNLHGLITKEKLNDHQLKDPLCCGLLNRGLCCFLCGPCNRRRVVKHYNINETIAETGCISCCCCCCGQCQEMNEIAYRSSNGSIALCGCECLRAGTAQRNRYTKRNLVGSRIGKRSGNQASPPVLVAVRSVEQQPTIGNNIMISGTRSLSQQYVSTAESIKFVPKLDLGNKKDPIKKSWVLKDFDPTI